MKTLLPKYTFAFYDCGSYFPPGSNTLEFVQYEQMILVDYHRGPEPLTYWKLTNSYHARKWMDGCSKWSKARLMWEREGENLRLFTSGRPSGYYFTDEYRKLLEDMNIRYLDYKKLLGLAPFREEEKRSWEMGKTMKAFVIE